MPETALRYPLCRQTVTLYHLEEQAEKVSRTVLQGVFFDLRRRRTTTEAGRQEAEAFLLIVPQAAARWGEAYTLAPGDRVLAGVGPEVDWDGWETFVPETTPGLCCVQYVHPKYLAGTPCHLEAGGWWTRTGKRRRRWRASSRSGWTTCPPSRFRPACFPAGGSRLRCGPTFWAGGGCAGAKPLRCG